MFRIHRSPDVSGDETEAEPCGDGVSDRRSCCAAATHPVRVTVGDALLRGFGCC